MKILVDEMPACKDDCMFAAMFWENTKWKNCCTLSNDGESDCDLKNEECSFLKVFESR